MKNLLLMMAVTTTFVACDQRDRPYNSNDKSKTTTTTTIETREVQDRDLQDRSVTAPVAPDYDNTIRNMRDRNGTTLTSGDQSESELDRAISQKIRQAVMADDSLSTNAKNVKVITVNGVVTLRGPVSSIVEKEAIGRKATGVQGVSRVDNQIEVTRNY